MNHDPQDQPHETNEGVLDRLERAAIEAEFETGEREETVEEAQRHVLKRLGVIALGYTVLVAGVIMMLLPGPGLLAIAAGLGILSTEVAWADRALRKLKARVPGIPEDGKIPRSAIVTAVVVGLAATLAGTWWFTR